MSYETQLTQLISEVGNLTNTVSGKFQEWDNKVNQAKSQIDSFIANARGEFPVTPNLLKNTKFFLWTGEVIDANNPYGSKENQWISNTLPQFWGWSNYTDANGDLGDTQFQAKTIHVKNQQAWIAENLPSLDEVPLIRSDLYGANNVRALILDISRTKGGTVILNQDCHAYASWHVGNFWLTEKFYVAILSKTGDIDITLPGNRFPAIKLGNLEPNKWHYITTYKQGFGGCIQGRLFGAGTLKIAILLPYVSFGKLAESMHVWAGYVGSDKTAYSHSDLIVSSQSIIYTL